MMSPADLTALLVVAAGLGFASGVLALRPAPRTARRERDDARGEAAKWRREATKWMRLVQRRPRGGAAHA
jgi:hypothetical protein